ncbi:MAG TPA: GDSL-type esterase/lipase family protein [Candidatus Acidoferrum sp.]|nr:GDSL-type esterase/lipase family protein [Candidatus Acidoferrum sp.]
MFANFGLRRIAATVVGGLSTLALLVSGSAPAAANDDHSYLALGDSVVFGYITQAGYEYTNPHNFVGYPDYVSQALRFSTTNASCPGEATGGFISVTGADNGCRPYKANFPLHVSYSGTQLDFATAFLKTHQDTRLVSIGLGANDAFLLESACAGVPACIANGLPQVLATISANMRTILDAIRATHFHGVLMIVNYYSLDYSDTAGTGLTELLNGAITAPAAADQAVVADVFDAFKTAANTTFAGGNTCKAGLLNASPQNQLLCDVHPSQSGQQLIAHTVENTYAAAAGD